jgi:hypothetical protein
MLSVATSIKQASAHTKISPVSANTPTTKLALNQSTEVICGDGRTTYARAETKGYYINECKFQI